MSVLEQVVGAVARHGRAVEAEIRRARKDPKFARDLLKRWNKAREDAGTVATPTGMQLPRLALPQTDEPGEIARYLLGEGLPGQFPFVNATYRQMYQQDGEEPTRLFAGLGLAEDTNARFHYLTKHQRTIRLSTAFDGPTLYGMDSDADGAFGKIGEGGVAIDTVE